MYKLYKVKNCLPGFSAWNGPTRPLSPNSVSIILSDQTGADPKILYRSGGAIKPLRC